MHTPLFNCNPPPGNPGRGPLQGFSEFIEVYTGFFQFFFCSRKAYKNIKGGTVTFRKEKKKKKKILNNRVTKRRVCSSFRWRSRFFFFFFFNFFF